LKLVFVLTSLLACMVSAELSPECKYVNQTRYMYDAAKVKACFESYQINQDFIDAIVKNLEVISDIYPYVDIAKNPPQTIQRRNPVNYKEKFEELKTSLAKSNRVISEVFRPTIKFISSFHDGHFGMSVTYDLSEDLFNYIGCVFPFFWEYIPDANGTFHIYINTREPEYFLDEETHNKIVQKLSEGVFVDKVDDVDAFNFFAEFFGEYNSMKSLQGSFKLTVHQTNRGFDILKYPLETLFDNHTIHFSDGDTITFNMGFANAAVPGTTRDMDIKWSNPITPVTLKEELEILERLKKNGIRSLSSRTKRAPSGVIECGHDNGMNFITVKSFNTQEPEAFLLEMISCGEIFDENDDPITIYLPMNGGGIILLELALFFYLMPNADPSIIGAYRKTDTNKRIAIDGKYAASLSDNKDYCHLYALDPKAFYNFWDKTYTDDLGGGIFHNRTKKANMIFKEELVGLLDCLPKKPRKPTDIIVVTDGFCFSACSMFVDNVIRTGSGIVTGIGATHPGDELFVAAQCPSSVIDPASFLKELKDNDHLGIHFQVTFMETYNISADNKEVIPGDYETMYIDKHLHYYEMLNPEFDEIIKRTKIVHEEFKNSCNPNNHRLFLVNDKCTVADKHATTFGYACGSDGKWNTSDCRIATCSKQYAVDFNNNKCMLNDCDPRYPFPDEPSEYSSSNMIHPFLGFISIVLLVLFHFVR